MMLADMGIGLYLVGAGMWIAGFANIAAIAGLLLSFTKHGAARITCGCATSAIFIGIGLSIVVFVATDVKWGWIVYTTSMAPIVLGSIALLRWAICSHKNWPASQ